MKLQTKITLFITLSKGVIVLLFVILLPLLVDRIASDYTNYYLRQQKQKVIKTIEKNGLDSYLLGDSSYGSYTMLLEEYVALELLDSVNQIDTILTSRRIIESDTLSYRVLMYGFKQEDQPVLLEIGKTVASIEQYNAPLQKLALYVLSSLVLLTMILDLVYIKKVLRPLNKIIRHRLLNQKFPFRKVGSPRKYATTDFAFLDASLVSLMEKIHDAFEKEREFASNASHELMTPISIMQSKLENLMLDENLAEGQLEKMDEMLQSVSRLKKIVQALMLIARVENDQYMRSDSVRLDVLLNEVQQELEHRLEEKEIAFQIEIQENTVIEKANRDLLFQLLYNLINNAIKYNKFKGKITVQWLDSQTGSRLIRIQDTGIGIPEDEIPHLFERFNRNKTRSQNGHGLGLSIVRSIANYHGFKLSVKSTSGVGTIIDVIIP